MPEINIILTALGYRGEIISDSCALFISDYFAQEQDAINWVIKTAKEDMGIDLLFIDRKFIRATPEAELLEDIKTGRKKVLPGDHWFFRHGLDRLKNEPDLYWAKEMERQDHE